MPAVRSGSPGARSRPVRARVEDGRAARPHRARRLKRWMISFAALWMLVGAFGVPSGPARAQAGTPPASAEASPTAMVPLLPTPGRSGFANFVAVTAGGGSGGTVLLDTGSTGLRIRQEALGPDVRLTTIPLTYSYTSGNVLNGVLGYAVVAFPSAAPALATPRPIAIHVVQSITCKPDVPRCPGWRASEVGVMGVAYSPVAVFNPLAQLGGALGNGFIVVANDYADPAVTPHLEVGLTAQNSAGFAFAPFEPRDGQQPAGLKAWNTKSIPTCFAVNGGAPGCFATVFDTGAGSGSFQTPGLAPALLHTRVPRGAQVTTSVDGVMRLTVTAGRRPWVNQYRYEPPHGSVKGFNAGGLVFRHYRVLFDGETGRIGFSPSVPVAAAPAP